MDSAEKKARQIIGCHVSDAELGNTEDLIADLAKVLRKAEQVGKDRQRNIATATALPPETNILGM